MLALIPDAAFNLFALAREEVVVKEENKAFLTLRKAAGGLEERCNQSTSRAKSRLSTASWGNCEVICTDGCLLLDHQ